MIRNYLKNLNGSFLNNPASSTIFWGISGNMGKVVAQGLYFIIIAKALGANQFGLFSSAFAFVNILSPISMFGSGNLLVMNVSRDRDSFERFFGNSLIFLSSTSILLILLVLFLARFFLPNTPILIIVSIAIAELFFYRFLDLASQTFQAFENMRVSANIYLLGSFFRLAVSLIFLLFPSHNALLWSLAYLLSNIIVGISALIYVLKTAGSPKIDKSLIKYTLTNGWSYSIGVSSTSVYSDIDKVYLSKFDQSSVVGSYNASYRIILLLITPLQALVYSLNTKMFQLGEDGLKNLIPLVKKISFIIAFYFIIASIAIYLVKPLIPKILGGSYQESSVIVMSMLFLLPLSSMNYLIGDILMGAGYQRQRSIIQIGIAFLTSILGFFMVRTFSWQGGIITTLSGQAILLILLFSFLIFKNRRG